MASNGVTAEGCVEPSLSPTGAHTRSYPPHSSSPTTSVRSYLEPVTSLNSESLDTLKSLLRITVDLRRSTATSRRIQRGSPGAGVLGSILANVRPRVHDIVDKLSEIFKTYGSFPGMYLISTQFPVFRDVLNENFNDGGNDPGYGERVRLLETLMYLAGTLRGHVEMVLEQHGHWKAKLAGEKPARLARRLNFNQTVDPAKSEPESVTAMPLAKSQELLPAQHTFKVAVNLPEEMKAALSLLWEEQKFTDIEFIVCGQRVPAHKAVLAAQSQYFECMLFGNMKEASMNEIPLEDVPVSAFRKVLQFGYTGCLEMDNVALQDILEVTMVADRFGFISLKEALGDQLSQHHISIDSVLILLVHSEAYHLPQLNKSCQQFIESHTTQVLQHPSLLHLPKDTVVGIISRDTFVAPEIEIFKAVQKWKEHNKKGVEEIAKLLECIRLSEFSSAEQIFSEVEPTGLLDDRAILAGVRVMCKPCVTEMNPRGRKERNKNLFTSPMVVFDPTTPPTYRAPPLQPHQLTLGFQPPPQQCVADTIIELGLRPGGYIYPDSRPRDVTASSMIIALGDLYIINYLYLKGYPSTPDDEQLQGKCFSYIVSVSRDKRMWLKLFDYTAYACRGAQHLLFPKQAARYIRMDLKWREDETRTFPLQFSACCLVNERRQFSFLPNGVIAPQYEHDVVTVPWSGLDGKDQMCVAYFRQPYSAAYTRFSVECSDEDVSSVDITVSVGLMESTGSGGGGGASDQTVSTGNVLGGGGFCADSLPLGGLGSVLVTGGIAGNGDDCNTKNVQNKVKLQDMDNIVQKSPVVVNFKERIINYVVVTVRMVHRKPHPVVTLPPTTSTAKPGDDLPIPVRPDPSTSVPSSAVASWLVAPKPVGLVLSPVPGRRVGNGIASTRMLSSTPTLATQVKSSGSKQQPSFEFSATSQPFIPHNVNLGTTDPASTSSSGAKQASQAQNVSLSSSAASIFTQGTGSTAVSSGVVKPPGVCVNFGSLAQTLGTSQTATPQPRTTSTGGVAVEKGEQSGQLNTGVTFAPTCIISGVYCPPSESLQQGQVLWPSEKPRTYTRIRRSPQRSPAPQVVPTHPQQQPLQPPSPTSGPRFKIIDVVCKSSIQ